MTVQNMAERTLGRKPGYSHSEELLTGVTSDPVVIPPLNGQPVSVTMIAGANTGKIQFTTSTDAKVAAGTATWQDWPSGVVTGTVSDTLISPVTAVRGVSDAGTVDFEIII